MGGSLDEEPQDMLWLIKKMYDFGYDICFTGGESQEYGEIYPIVEYNPIVCIVE
jgi:hypothetical protein